jgi:hypothetical protein
LKAIAEPPFESNQNNIDPSADHRSVTDQLTNLMRDFKQLTVTGACASNGIRIHPDRKDKKEEKQWFCHGR